MSRMALSRTLILVIWIRWVATHLIQLDTLGCADSAIRVRLGFIDKSVWPCYLKDP